MRAGCLKLLLMVISVCNSSLEASAQFIKDSYRFNNTLSVSPPDCGNDLLPMMAPVACPPVPASGGFYENVSIPPCGVTRTVYHNNLHWGLQYLNSEGTIGDTYTINIFLRVANWGGQLWTRIIDFSTGLSDNGIYFKKETPSDSRCIDFYPNGIVGTCPYFSNVEWYLLTFTRDGATGMMQVYVNDNLFASYHDVTGMYKSAAGKPVYIFRDDQPVPCEAGQAQFAYLSFSNQYSLQSTVDSVYNEICTIANTDYSANFSLSPSPVCLNQEVTVTYTGDIPAPGNGHTFSWNFNGATVVSGTGMGPHIVKWTNAGTYTVDLVVHNITCDNQNSKSQSINVLQSLQQPTIIDYSMCPGESFLGYTDQGTYTDTFVSARGCDSIRILNLTVVGAINSTINIAICEGQSYAGYSDEGTYVDTFHAVSGCDTIRTIHLTFKPKASLNLGPDKELCAGDSLVLAAGSFLAYLWQDGSTQSYFVVKKEGMYSVSVTDSCGSVSDDIIISEKNCEPYFPNAFTPNNDGRNDLFKLLQATNVSEYSLTVYNRWGEKIFETNNPLQGWDGTVAGKRAQSGVFAWFSRFKRNSQEIKMKGTILLIR